ncbi:MAG: PEP-CTERM sorting domain-containing protein [Candidatus Pacebacteria bacterium]|nr:PEP-CTERM sorting domain-containing protein [Candidatus Paceibacterota bacterium]
MKKLIASIFTGFMLVAGVAQATVIMTDGSLEVYDPNETYVPSGTLGSDIFSIGWIYTNPSYANDINLIMPSDMVGKMLWAVTSGINATGLSYFGGSLLAGESDVVPMGHFLLASSSRPFTEWFSMANFDIPSPIAFGPTVEDGLIDFPGSDLGGDTGGGVIPSPVPEPSTMALISIGLLVVTMVARRRKMA